MVSDDDLLLLNKLLLDEENYKASSNLLLFTEKTMPNFKAEKFHKVYYKLLDLFAKGTIKRLMITMPPQHGKSEGSTRRLPAYLLGLNPDLKIAIASYTTTFARKFNKDVQRIIDTKKYIDIFEETKLSGSKIHDINSDAIRNADEFEIVNHFHF